MIKLITKHEKQIIMLTGDKGIGKTSFVQKVASRIKQRKLIHDGIYYLDFKEISSASQINSLFQQEGIDFFIKDNCCENANKQHHDEHD